MLIFLDKLVHALNQQYTLIPKNQQDDKAGYLMKTLHFGQIDYRVGSVLIIVGDHSSLEEVQMKDRDEFL